MLKLLTWSQWHSKNGWFSWQSIVKRHDFYQKCFFSFLTARVEEFNCTQIAIWQFSRTRSLQMFDTSHKFSPIIRLISLNFSSFWSITQCEKTPSEPRSKERKLNLAFETSESVNRQNTSRATEPICDTKREKSSKRRRSRNVSESRLFRKALIGEALLLSSKLFQVWAYSRKPVLIHSTNHDPIDHVYCSSSEKLLWLSEKIHEWEKFKYCESFASTEVERNYHVKLYEFSRSWPAPTRHFPLHIQSFELGLINSSRTLIHMHQFPSAPHRLFVPLSWNKLSLHFRFSFSPLVPFTRHFFTFHSTYIIISLESLNVPGLSNHLIKYLSVSWWSHEIRN